MARQTSGRNAVKKGKKIWKNKKVVSHRRKING
jgi:hypothetical protein